MKLRPHCLSNIPTINGSWICADCRQTPRPTTYVYRMEHFCRSCMENRLKVEFMDLLLDASPELTLDGVMVHVAALVVDERLRLQDDPVVRSMTGADRAELSAAERDARDRDGLTDKEVIRIATMDLALAKVLDGASIIEAWNDGAHVPEEVRPFARAVVARAEMLKRLLTVYTDSPLWRLPGESSE